MRLLTSNIMTSVRAGSMRCREFEIQETRFREQLQLLHCELRSVHLGSVLFGGRRGSGVDPTTLK